MSEFLALLCFLVSGFILGFIFGAAVAYSGWRQRAIDHNAAEWRVDPKTGETEFVWLTGKGQDDE